MQRIEMEISEVSELIGVSENTLYKDFKKCVNKLEQHNISYEGKGKNRKFYITEQDIFNPNKEAYDTFKQIVYNVYKFDRQIDIDKLLHFMIVVLKNQTIMNHTSILTHNEIADIIGLEQRQTIAKYKKRLVDYGVIQVARLSKFATYCTKLDYDFQTYTSELIPSEHNTIQDNPDKDNFKYSVKLKPNEIEHQEYEEKCYIPCENIREQSNDLFDSYVRACGVVANTKYMKNKSDYQQVSDMVENGLSELKITPKDKYIAFQDFKRELGIDKLWKVCKTEYTPRFMKDIVLLDIIVRAFKFKFDNLYENEIDKYVLDYVEVTIQNDNNHIKELA